MNFGPRYEIRRTLGEGGFGVVYEAFDRDRQELVALKTFNRADATELVRFKTEFRAFSDFVHPNLVRLYELASHEGRWFFTMERVYGSTWLDHVAPASATMDRPSQSDVADALEQTEQDLGTNSRSDEMGQRVRIRRAVDVERLRATLPGLVAGLRYLHDRQIVHCDIKPSNVLVTEDGRPVILDFGIATRDGVRLSGVTEAQRALGTPTYMSPEQVEARPATSASDAYAVGTMLFEALTEGRLPFEGASLMSLVRKCSEDAPRVRDLAPDAPSDLAAATDRLISRRAEDRVDLSVLVGESVPTSLPSIRPEESFIGRSRELARLDLAFERSRGGPVVVHVHGPSGTGKSTFVSHAVQSAAGAPRVLAGRCFQRERVPFKAFDILVDELCRVLRRMTSAQRAAALPPDVDALVRLFPVLERVPGLSAPRDVDEGADDRIRAFAAFRELLASLADTGPLVVVLDDVQWGDADSARLLAHLLSPPRAPAVAFVLVSRGPAESAHFFDEFLARCASLAIAPRIDDLPLDRLDETDAVTLARNLLVSSGRAPDLADSIAVAAGGLPIFVRELVAAGGTGEGVDELPRSVDELILRRLAAKPPVVRAVVDMVAVANRGVTSSEMVALSGLDVATLSRALPELCREHVLRVDGGDRERFRPFHDRVREAVLAGMDSDRLKTLHARLAERYASTPSVDPDWVYGHAREAGMLSLAAEWAVRAADAASASYASDRAAALYEDALQLLPASDERRPVLLRRKAESLERAHRSRASAAAYVSLAELPTSSPEEKIQARVRAGEQLITLGEDEAGMALVLPAMEELGVPVPRTRASIVFRYLALRVWLALFGRRRLGDRSRRSVDLLRRDVAALTSMAIVLVDLPRSFYYGAWMGRLGVRIGDPVAGAAWKALFASGDYFNGMISADRAQADSLAAERWFDDSELGIAFAAQARWGRALVSLIRGQAESAADEFARQLAGDGLRGHSSTFKLCAYYYLAALGWSGRYAELDRREQEFRAWAAERDDLFLSAMLGGGEGSLAWLVRDAVDQGRPFVRRSLRAWRPDAKETDLPRIYGEWSLALFDAYDGDAESAYWRTKANLARFAYNPFVATKTVTSLTRIFLARYAVQAWQRAPARPDLRRAARASVRSARRGCFSTYTPLVDLVEAGLREVEGDTPRAKTVLRRGMERCAELGFVALANMARHELAQLDPDGVDSATVERVTAWLQGESVRRPDRFIAVHLPGLPTSRALLEQAPSR